MNGTVIADVTNGSFVNSAALLEMQGLIHYFEVYGIKPHCLKETHRRLSTVKALLFLKCGLHLSLQLSKDSPGARTVHV
jgi:hypothetical protein